MRRTLTRVACLFLLGCSTPYGDLQREALGKVEKDALGAKQLPLQFNRAPASTRMTTAGPAGTPGAGEASPSVGRIDVHSHIFNIEDLPAAGFVTRILVGKGVPIGIAEKIRTHFLNALQRDLFAVSECRAGQPCKVPNLLKALDDFSKCRRKTPGAVAAGACDEGDLATWVNAVTINVTQTKALGQWLDKNTVTELLTDAATIVRTLSDSTYSSDKLAMRLANGHRDVAVFLPSLVDFSYWTDIRWHQGPSLCDLAHPKASTPPADPSQLVPDPRPLGRQVAEQMVVSARSIYEGPATTGPPLFDNKPLTPLMGDTDPDGAKLEHPAHFLPLVAFNPLREVADETCGQTDYIMPPSPNRRSITVHTALDVVKEAIEHDGFVGVKLYPPSGFLPTGNVNIQDFGPGLGRLLDDVLEKFYKYCEDNDVPLLVHANRSNALGADYDWRAGPWGWRAVLEKHPKLRLNLGHFGELTGVIDTAQRISCISWPDGFAALMLGNPNVYGDLSYTPALTGAADACKIDGRWTAEAAEAQWKSQGAPCADTAHVFELLTSLIKGNSKIVPKLLYGSDWWMSDMEQGWPQYSQRFTSLIHIIESDTKTALSDPFFAGNALEYLGFAKDDKGNKNYCREVAFAREVNPGRELPFYLGFLDPTACANP